MNPVSAVARATAADADQEPLYSGSCGERRCPLGQARATVLTHDRRLSSGQRNSATSARYVHAKDVRHERGACDVDGVLDTKTIDRFADRSWNYVALGHGHDVLWWKEFFSVLGMCGYRGTVSLEMEDLTMEPLAALRKSTSVLKEALPRDFGG